MKLRRQVATKIVTGLALVILSAFVAMVINAGLSARQSEKAIPEMQVYYGHFEGEEQLPQGYIWHNAYTWRFMFWLRSGTGAGYEAFADREAAWVPPSTALRLDFSYEPSEVKVSMATDQADNFVELGGQLMAPSGEGTYTYRVEASWGGGKQVEYYFRIRVPQW